MPGELYFFYHVYGSSLQLEAFGGNGWAPVWSAAWQGGQDHNWALARVTIPPDSGLLRFVGTPTGGSYGGYYDGVALDGIGLEAPKVDFLALSCDFQWHACFWFSTGNSAWQPVASQAEGSWFLEASTNVSVDQTFTLESARFNATSGRCLLVRYQLAGSSSISLQSQSEGGTWATNFQHTAATTAVAITTSADTPLDDVTIRVPHGTVALRIRANITTAEDVVTVYSVQALPCLKDISCDFETDGCGWEGWNSETRLDPPRPEYELFQGERWIASEPLSFCTSSAFPPAHIAFVSFAFRHAWPGVELELQYLSNGVWRRRASFASYTGFWQQPKLELWPGTERLRFVDTASIGIGGVALDTIVAWESDTPAPEVLSLSAGFHRSCAVRIKTGQLKCWGSEVPQAQDSLGTSPFNMGANLVDLGAGNRVQQVACGSYFTCAVLWQGSLKCWGPRALHVNQHPAVEPNSTLATVDLGVGQIVVQVGCGWDHICVLLQSGTVKCFGDRRYLGLGDGLGPRSL